MNLRAVRKEVLVYTMVGALVLVSCEADTTPATASICTSDMCAAISIPSVVAVLLAPVAVAVAVIEKCSIASDIKINCRL